MASGSPARRSPIAWLQFLILAAAIGAFPIAARAGPWTPEAGRGLSIVSLALGPEGDGNRDWAKAETSLYIEQGLPGGAALIFAPSVEARLGASSQYDPAAAGAHLLGIRTPRFARGHYALATQLSVLEGRIPGASGTTERRRSLGIEARALAGRSFSNQGFAAVELGWRHWTEATNEVRLETSLGFPLSARKPKGTQWLLQAFAEAPISQRGDLSDPLVRAQFSLVLPVSEAISIQTGVRTTLMGAGWRDHALVIGLWRRF
jgi:hypothetical protein